MRRSTHAGASAGGGDGVPFAEPKKTFAGQQGLHSSELLQQDLVLDEIYSLSHHHVSAALKIETGFIQQASAEIVNRAAETSVAAFQSNKRHCGVALWGLKAYRKNAQLDIKLYVGLLPS